MSANGSQKRKAGIQWGGMKTIPLIDLDVREQPLVVIVYHKILNMALALGATDEAAELLAETVSGRCRNDANVCLSCEIHCEIQCETETILLVISPSDIKASAYGAWQDQLRLPGMPDAALIEQQRRSLPEMSLTALLSVMHSRHAELGQQRNRWKQEAGQLSLEMERNQQSMQHQLMHDTLTGLPNRRLLAERARHLLQIAKRQQLNCCLILMDLNDFKNINDVLGHQAGDWVLCEVSGRLKSLFRTSDLLARLGGDEFAVLLFNNSTEQAELVAGKLRQALSHSFEYEGHVLTVGGSIGIAEYPAHGDDLDSLMRRADVAMYYAKKKKLNTAVYDVLLDKHSVERMSLIDELSQAINSDGMELYYQPQVHMTGDSRLSVEALIRWNHAEKGMVFPDQFIPLAEDSGLIIPMTWWVLESAARQCAAWHRCGLHVNVSINISAGFLQEKNVVQRIADCIDRHKLPDNVLVLEITENTLMEDPHQASKILIEINDMKVDVSIDDFGTGYSSLAYLKHLEVDELKIDRSFIVGMNTYKNDKVIVQTVISMAHHMGLRVVAEGVEERKDWDRLAEMGCDFIQGYFISRPQPVDKITGWLENFSNHGLQLDDE